MSDTQLAMFADKLPAPDIIAWVINTYRQCLLSNPPAGMFQADNPKREAAARFAAKRDVVRFVGILEKEGYQLTTSLEPGQEDHGASTMFQRFLRSEYVQKLLDNPPTLAFFEGNRERQKLAARVAAKDVQRLLEALRAQRVYIAERKQG